MKYSKPYIITAAYLLLSFCAIFFASYTREIARWIMLLDAQVNDTLALVFSISPLGVNLRQIVTLAVTPVLIMAIPAVLYQVIKHKPLPYLVQMVWILWIITALSRLLSQ